MDPRVAGAGVAMAVAMLLLLPTFNALNQSYDSSVPPPDWFRPDKIPENIKPPEDIEDYPEGWEPPPNMTPPPGWEPPPGYEGPVPEGGCPPPVFRPLDEWTDSGGWSTSNAPSGRYTEELTFQAPKYMVGFGGNITFTDWRAQTVSYVIEDPSGQNIGGESRGGQGAGSVLFPAAATPETALTYQTDDPRETGELPPEGEYTLRLVVDTPIEGSWETEFVVAIACGGMLS